MHAQKVYIETYGCQMNVNDSEIVLSLLQKDNFAFTDHAEEADVILINTCSIREHAETRIHGRIQVMKQLKKKKPSLLIAILGCMAERMQDTLLSEGIVSIVAGPDSYRNLPALIRTAQRGQTSLDVLLSTTETYEEIIPERYEGNRISTFTSIMRGCNNYCSYCVVPYTRGRERSRPPDSIIAEIQDLLHKGYKEVTLLGQNVNSYAYKKENTDVDFSKLLTEVAKLDPSLRVRFATSHPKDLSNKLLETIALYPNICKHIHLPLQSGSTTILEKMNRRYTREQYMERIESIRRIINGCSITTDIIAGFCTETEHDHQQTLRLMEWAQFDFAYMFKYSKRPGTKAAEKFPDDVPEEVKTRRLEEIISLQNCLSQKSNASDVGTIFEVLVEGPSKKNTEEYCGRTSQNKTVVFPNNNFSPGQYINVKITSSTQATLLGIPVE